MKSIDIALMLSENSAKTSPARARAIGKNWPHSKRNQSFGALRLASIVAFVATLAILGGCSRYEIINQKPHATAKPLTASELPSCDNLAPVIHPWYSSESFVPPRPKSIVKPTFPKSILRDGLAGLVVLEFQVDETGQPCNIALVRSRSVGIFVESAVRALMQSRFKPAMLNGEAVSSYGAYTYVFAIRPKMVHKLARLKRAPIPRKEPAYPVAALLNQVGGHVTFIVKVNKKGEPVNYKVVESKPEGVFDVYAAMALMNNRFKVRYENSEPVPYRGKVTYKFRVPKYFK